MAKRAILVVVVTGLLGCGSNSPTYTQMGGNACTPTANEVCMMNRTFNPSNLSIAHGTTVTWKNGDAVNHTVGNASGSAETFTSGFIGAGATFSHTFATPGTFEYYCAIHGMDGSPPTGMHGTITVN